MRNADTLVRNEGVALNARFLAAWAAVMQFASIMRTRVSAFRQNAWAKRKWRWPWRRR